MMIEENIAKIRARVALACSKVKRDPQGVSIVAVSKTRTLIQIQEVIRLGVSDIGESRVREASLKYSAINNTQYPAGVRWHLVGHLQTNKAKEAVRIFDLIQSVDSLRLAQEIDKQALLIGKIQDILVEIKTSSEATKSGVKPEDAIGILKEMSNLKNINVQGLMTIAPLVDNSEEARPYFHVLRDLRDKIYELRFTNYALRILSMGMTDDFEVAIEEGATMVRIGRAIFEPV